MERWERGLESEGQSFKCELSFSGFTQRAGTLVERLD